MKRRMIVVTGLIGCMLAGSAFSGTLSVRSISLIRLYELEQSLGSEEKNFFAPFYQYLDIEFRDIETKGVSVKLNGWGNFQLADYELDEEGRAILSDLDLNYAYVDIGNLYGNARVRLGRQFIYMGVASAEQMDGGQFQIPVVKGKFGKVELGGYFGVPTQYDIDNRSKDFITGGKLYYVYPGTLSIGFSGLYSTEEGEPDRGWIGVDLWVEPVKWLEIGGKLYYSILSEGIYDASVLPIIKPVSSFQITLKYMRTVPNEYLGDYSIFPVFTSMDAMTELGGIVSYDVTKKFTLWADFSWFDYEGGENAYQYGVFGRYKYGNKLQNSLSGRLRRLESEDVNNAYSEISIFLKHKLSKPSLEFGLNSVNLIFDHKIGSQRIKYSTEQEIFVGYFFKPNMEVVGSFVTALYDGDTEYRGIVKLNYEFDSHLVR